MEYYEDDDEVQYEELSDAEYAALQAYAAAAEEVEQNEAIEEELIQGLLTLQHELGRDLSGVELSHIIDQANAHGSTNVMGLYESGAISPADPGNNEDRAYLLAAYMEDEGASETGPAGE